MRTAVRAFLVMFCAGMTVNAQESSISLPLLNRSAAATAVGEGGAFLSGLDSLGANPGGLTGVKQEWNATYRQMPLDTSLSAMAVSWPLRPIDTTFAISYTALRSVGLERRTELGERAGEFNHEDQMLGLHAAHPFVLGDSEIAGGISLKGIQSRIDRYSGTGLAIDLGFCQRIKGIPLTLAATAMNMGQGPKLITERSELPTSFGLSASYQAHTTFALFGGGSYQTGQNIVNVSVGADYRFGNVLAFRGHYAAGSSAEGQSGVGQLIGGIGVFLGKFRLDYTFQPAGEELSEAGAPATQHATLTLEF
jgi:hypothetical protein